MKLQRHFKSAQLEVSDGQSNHKLEISEWVSGGSILITLESDSSKDSFILQAGENVELIDSSTARSTLAGYPSLDITESGSQKTAVINIEPMVAISEDGWSVRLTLYPPIPGSVEVGGELILEQLEQLGVRFGIRENAIKSACEKVSQERSMVQNLIICRGRLPVNGKDGWLRSELELDVRPGKESLDGSIDYKERNLFVDVRQGQHLATIVSATSGMVGKDIYGNEVPQRVGEPLVLSQGEDIIVEAATGIIRAAFAGVVSIANGRDIRVTNLQVIGGDVDYSTGNIRSKAAIEIRGDVLPGFKVTADGDVVINGEVSGAQITSKSNVMIGGRVTGKNAHIEAGGDITLNFIEEASISCGGSVTVASSIYFSDIRSDGSIIAPGGAKIVASTLIAGESITLGQVDTISSPSSILAVACSPERLETYNAVQEAINADKIKITRLSALVGPDSEHEELQALIRQTRDNETLLHQFNLVPDGSADEPASGLRYASQQKIVIETSLEQGAEIRIGNSLATLRTSLEPGTITLDPDDEKIVYKPTGENKLPITLSV